MNSKGTDKNYLKALTDVPMFKETILLIRAELNKHNPNLDSDGIKKFAHELHVKASLLLIVLGLNERFLKPIKHYILTGRWVIPIIPQIRKEPFKRRAVRVDDIDTRRLVRHLKHAGLSHKGVGELLEKLNYHYADHIDVSKKYINRYNRILLALMPRNRFLIQLRLIKFKQILEQLH